MVSDKVPFNEQKKKSIEENLALFNRAKTLRERALKLIEQVEVEKDENIKS